MTKGSLDIDGNWLKEEFDRLGVSSSEVGKELGCDPKKIYNHINGETKLQAGILAALWVKYPKLDMRYILTGKRATPTNKAIIELEEASNRIDAAIGLLL